MDQRPIRRLIQKAKRSVVAVDKVAPTASATKKRYHSTEHRGDSVWKKEWNRFISGVEMRDMGDTISIERDLAEEPSEQLSSFGYLFSSATKRKAETKQQKKQNKATEASASRTPAARDNEASSSSKMQALTEWALKNGKSLEGLNRKERRTMLDKMVREEEASAVKEQCLSAEHLRPKPHELMDPKLAWYQQGPSPLDVVSERLVLKKSMKHARQNGWKYNFEAPHPSWLAARARKRREAQLVWLGYKVTFKDGGDDDTRPPSPLIGSAIRRTALLA